MTTGTDEPRGTPPSRRIADELRRLILNGELAIGAKLPSERELARVHGTARNTARQAIAILSSEGLVDAQHGRGVFVRPRKPFRRLGHDRYASRHRDAGRAPFRAEAEMQELDANVEVLSIEPVAAPPWVAERLSLPAGERVLLRRNLYLLDDEPVQLADTYLPLTIAQGTPLEFELPAPAGIYAALEQLGHRLARIEEEVTARMPRPEEVRALALAPGVPVLDLVHTSLDSEDLAVEVTHSILAGDRNALTFAFPVE